VLHATEDTFHYLRCGRLRPAEAKELLDAIQDVEYQLGGIREHALHDLLIGVGLTADPTAVDTADAPAAQAAVEAPEQPESETSPAGAPVSTPVRAWRGMWPTDTTDFDGQFAAALGALPVSAAVLASDAFGALAYKIRRRCQQTGETPTQVLNSISADDRAFAQHADDLAAFLVSRIDL
jgi:hypothetical protein